MAAGILLPNYVDKRVHKCSTHTNSVDTALGSRLYSCLGQSEQQTKACQLPPNAAIASLYLKADAAWQRVRAADAASL